ncbi:hypothetical protein FRUB_09354 [Fimbriiglobus ruber]|uniref:Uncharacterized protein n=1 Tax=Fimbriiglobus ruber TaxID=1908690 RepID=A0A225D5B3_9BACT|nr:hypothetical protein FRUB_09354 [Fimbriiglobus ruber]
MFFSDGWNPGTGFYQTNPICVDLHCLGPTIRSGSAPFLPNEPNFGGNSFSDRGSRGTVASVYTKRADIVPLGGSRQLIVRGIPALVFTKRTQFQWGQATDTSRSPPHTNRITVSRWQTGRL